MVKTIVVLGAGLVGLPLAHYLMRKTAAKNSDIRIILVSPNAEFFWNIASPRIAAAPAHYPDDKYLIPTAENFAQYPHSKDQFEFVLGKAETLDPAKNSVTIKLNDNDITRTIDYHTLIIATGSRYRDSMPWKNVGTSEETREAIAQLQRDIKAAKSIVVAGAGVTGVEFAGELASEYIPRGLCARMGWGAKTHATDRKQVTIVSPDPLPLEARFMESVRKTAKYELERLGVKFIGGARITGTPAVITGAASTGGDDDKGDAKGKQKTVELTNSADGSKQTIAADLVIPTYGLIPNTEFVSASLKDASGRVRQDKHLRAAGAVEDGHKNVFVLGDAGDLQAPQAVNAEAQLRHLMPQLDAHLESEGATEVGEYKFDPAKVTVGLSVGRDRATGQLGSFRPWSIVIWFFKRDLGASKVGQYAAGSTGFQGAWPK